MTAQTISAFAPVGPQLLILGSITIVPPTASSGLPVTVSVLSGPATISGNVVNFTALGIVTLAANQAGNGTYSAAAQVTTSFVVMQTGFSPINLSNIPAPNVVDALDYNSIFSQMLADLQSRDSTFTALVESDPAWKIIEVCAFREMMLRQRVNDAAKAVMLPYATGGDLENLASFYGVIRNTITPADPTTIPPTPAVMESDSSLRYRTTLALDGLSTAGPTNSYIFHTLQCPFIADCSVVGPPTVSPGTVLVSLLGYLGDVTNGDGNGAVNAGSISAVSALLNAQNVRPLTDSVTVQSVTINAFSISATIYTYAGPDSSVVMANAQASVAAYVASIRKVGYTVPRSGIIAALFVPGVENVILTSPASDVLNDYQHAGHCTAITLTNGGTAE